MTALTLIAGGTSFYYGVFWAEMAVREYRASLSRHAVFSASYAAACLALGIGAIAIAGADLHRMVP